MSGTDNLIDQIKRDKSPNKNNENTTDHAESLKDNNSCKRITLISENGQGHQPPYMHLMNTSFASTGKKDNGFIKHNITTITLHFQGMDAEIKGDNLALLLEHLGSESVGLIEAGKGGDYREGHFDVDSISFILPEPFEKN